MVTVDGYFRRRKDLWLDLRNRLPLPDGSASLVGFELEQESRFARERVASDLQRFLAHRNATPEVVETDVGSRASARAGVCGP